MDAFIFAPKEVVSIPASCFRKMKSAFDRVCHSKLLSQMKGHEALCKIVQVLHFSLTRQLRVKWCCLTSQSFILGNVIRQGSISRPYLFSAHVSALNILPNNTRVAVKWPVYLSISVNVVARRASTQKC